MTDRIKIQNRDGLNFFLTRKGTDSTKPTCFVLHGYSGCSTEPHVLAMADQFFNNGFNIIFIDTTHSLNGADGALEDNSIETHLHSLEDGIAHAKTQCWVNAPYALTGHSLGSIAIVLHAQNHPNEVNLLAPISSVVSGNLTHEAWRAQPEAYAKWKKEGFIEIISSGYKDNNGAFIKGRRPFKWFEANEPFDTLPHAKKMTMPVLLITGTHDTSTPPEHVQKLFDLIPNEKEMYVIDRADHCFTGPGQTDEMARLLDTWIKKHK